MLSESSTLHSLPLDIIRYVLENYIVAIDEDDIDYTAFPVSVIALQFVSKQLLKAITSSKKHCQSIPSF